MKLYRAIQSPEEIKYFNGRKQIMDPGEYSYKGRSIDDNLTTFAGRGPKNRLDKSVFFFIDPKDVMSFILPLADFDYEIASVEIPDTFLTHEDCGIGVYSMFDEGHLSIEALINYKRLMEAGPVVVKEETSRFWDFIGRSHSGKKYYGELLSRTGVSNPTGESTARNILNTLQSKPEIGNIVYNVLRDTGYLIQICRSAKSVLN